MIAKEDGSILGFELVTAPATFPIHKEEFKKFPFDEQVVSDRDGMHIHIDKKALSTLQQGKMFEFVYNEDNRNFLHKIAGRVGNNYCSTTSSKKTILQGLVESGGSLAYSVEGSHQTAFNISNKDTLELRIFQSPKTLEEFMARLEFTKALIDWTSPGQVSLRPSEFKELNSFLNYVTDCRKVYPNLFREVI